MHCLWTLHTKDPLPITERSRGVILVSVFPYHLIDTVTLVCGGLGWETLMDLSGKIGPTTAKYEAAWKEH